MGLRSSAHLASSRPPAPPLRIAAGHQRWSKPGVPGRSEANAAAGTGDQGRVMVLHGPLAPVVSRSRRACRAPLYHTARAQRGIELLGRPRRERGPPPLAIESSRPPAHAAVELPAVKENPKPWRPFPSPTMLGPRAAADTAPMTAERSAAGAGRTWLLPSSGGLHRRRSRFLAAAFDRIWQEAFATRAASRHGNVFYRIAEERGAGRVGALLAGRPTSIRCRPLPQG